jgi:hypothetical protein
LRLQRAALRITLNDSTTGFLPIMNASENRPLRQTFLVLPIVGIILLLTVAIDFAAQAAINQPWAKPDSLLQFQNELIDRGVIALLGLALVYAGFWINQVLAQALPNSATGSISGSALWGKPQFWTFVVASLLGLLFLLLIPWHASTSGQILSAANTRADQQEAQINFQIQQQKQEIQSVQAAGQIDQLLQRKDLSPDKIALLQELKKDPQAFDKKVAQQMVEMKKQKQQALDQVSKAVSLYPFRSEVRSLLLSFGFIAIGWTGLRDAR